MSINAVEKVLWELTKFPEKKLALMDEAKADELLNQYALAEDEKDLLKRWDVRELTDRGCSQMLALLAWGAIHGDLEMPEYMRRMNAPRST